MIVTGVTVTLAVVLIYFGFRNRLGKRSDAGQAVPGDSARPSPVPNAPPPQPATSASVNLAAQVAAAMQAQAKQSDDARKAGIRAHANREIPPISDEGRQAIARGQQARIAVKQVFPPRLPQRSMSYFGGLPIVPDEFDWPTVHNRKGLLERLNFLAQIDCSDLPPGPARDLFPEAGYLYFFAPLSDRFGPDAMHFVTRYQPGKATQKWEPLDMPFTSTIEPQDQNERITRGARTHFDRIEIEFGWIEEPSDSDVGARLHEGHAHAVASRIRAEKLDAFFGPPVPYDPSLSAGQAPKDALWAPYPGFPANWQTARLIRKLVEAHHHEETADVAERLKALGNAAPGDPEAQRLRQLQTALSTFGLKMSNVFFPTVNAGLKEFDAPPAEVKQKILDFLDDLRVNGMPSSKDRHLHHLRLPLVLNDWLAFAAVHGAEGGLADTGGAALIPREVVSALAYRHAGRKHQMLGLGEVVQVAADEMKDRYLLFLQLAPDAALNWTVGEMGPLQYWITPEDLAARRFDNTVLTIEAY